MDIVDWAETSETFRQIIERDRVVVQEIKKDFSINSKWPILPVDQLCELIVDCVNKTAPIIGEKTPYRMIRTTNVRNGRIDLGGFKYASQDTYEKWTRRAKLQKGDVILTREAPIGEVGFVQESDGVFLGQRLMQYRANKELLEPRFLLYSFLSPALQNQFKSHEGSGSVVSHIRVGDCFKFELSVPPLPEQRAIAHILGTLDDRIELNRRMNETLEAMARSLFKSWFVDFDGFSAEDMQASALGLIPKDWQIITFGDVAEQGKGTVNPTVSPEETFTHYSLPAFDIAQLPVQELGGAIKSNKTPLPPESVLVSKLNPHIPRIWLVGEAGCNAVCSTEFIVWTPKQPANSSFIYLLASSSEFNSAMRQLVTGTSNSHQRVKPEQLANIRVIAANDEVISKFSALAKPLMEKVLQHRQQSQQLSQLRDTLLPKLISGELRIKDAERLAETA
ncbi:type I restriction enzyme S subunit [Pseudomonas psychrotolerans]|nr:type I restriction enzyme S subunit [Pseudomonas psychrotolerans]